MFPGDSGSRAFFLQFCPTSLRTGKRRECSLAASSKWRFEGRRQELFGASGAQVGKGLLPKNVVPPERKRQVGAGPPQSLWSSRAVTICDVFFLELCPVWMRIACMKLQVSNLHVFLKLYANGCKCKEHRVTNT